MRSMGRSKNGFTLVEMIIVMAILGIIAAIGVPTVASYLPNYRLNQATRDVMSHIQLAKLTAVRRNTRCIVEFQPGSYDPKGGVGSFRIFLDSNNDWTFKDASGTDEELIYQGIGMPPLVTMYDVTFTDKGNGEPNSDLMVGFNPHGLSARAVSGALVFGDVRMQNSRNGFSRVVVSPSGHVRISRSPDGINWD